MTDSQSNKLDMYIIVNDFYLANQIVIDPVLARATAFGYLGTNITAINTEIAAQSTNTTGIAADKTALRNTLDSATNAILQTAKAWAIAIHNNTLVAEFDYPISDIQKIKDDTIQGFCDYRISLVNDNLASLVDYGIDAPAVTAWQDALNDYTAVLESPREAINARHLHTENLKNLFAETQDLLTLQTDPLMVIFKTTDPALYAAYKQARIIINRKGPSDKPDPSTPTATLFGTVTDIMTGLPISGATITFSFTTTPILTEPDGTYRIENIPAGEYQIQIEAINYAPYDDSVILEENAEFELNVQLNPIPIVP